jgi:hypothetical protein
MMPHDTINSALGTNFEDPDMVGRTSYTTLIELCADAVENAGATDPEELREALLEQLSDLSDEIAQFIQAIAHPLDGRLQRISQGLKKLARRDDLFAALGSVGPFDGGCIICAEALRRVFGGEIWGAYSGDDWQHAVLRLDEDCYLDMDGVSTRDGLVQRWLSVEQCSITKLLPTPGICAQATYDEEATLKVEAIMRTFAMGEHLL